jgi:hypothetical protein
MSLIPSLSAPISPPSSVVSYLTPSVSINAASATFNSPVPQISAPDLKLSSISAPNIGVSNISNLSLSSISAGVPTSAGGIAASAGINTNMPPAQALQTLGVPTTLSGVGVPINLPALQLPQMPNFPGLDMAGINLGAGPKFIANTLLKYKTIVPPFVPGLKINMAMVGSAISIAKAASSGNLGGLLTSLTANLVESVKDQTGVNSVQEQVKSQLNQATGTSVLGDLQSKYDDYTASATEAAQSAADSAQATIDNQTNVGTPPS